MLKQSNITHGCLSSYMGRNHPPNLGGPYKMDESIHNLLLSLNECKSFDITTIDQNINQVKIGNSNSGSQVLPDSNIWYLQSVTPVGGNDIGVISRAPDIGAIACVGGLFSGYCFLKK